MRDLKMRHQTAGVENAGLENAGNDIVWNAIPSCVRQRRDGVRMLVSLRTSCNETIEEDRFVKRVQ